MTLGSPTNTVIGLNNNSWFSYKYSSWLKKTLGSHTNIILDLKKTLCFPTNIVLGTNYNSWFY